MFVNHMGEACFKVLVIGSGDVLEFVSAIHAASKEELRSELSVTSDPSWSVASFQLSFSGLKSKDRPVRAHFWGHSGPRFLVADSAELKQTFADADAVVIRAGTDVEDDLASSTTMLASGRFPRDAIVVLTAPNGTEELAEQARQRCAPRPTQTLIGDNKPTEALKLVIKAMLQREGRKPG
jgi:hypothetical protein